MKLALSFSLQQQFNASCVLSDLPDLSKTTLAVFKSSSSYLFISSDVFIHATKCMTAFFSTLTSKRMFMFNLTNLTA